MSMPWSEIHAHNRATEAMAERLELRIHAIAWLITATVLAMRLVAGRQDLTSDATGWDDPSPNEPAAEATAAQPY
ncbi:MAG TPA: hypothetical protein VNN80_15070 [Polyangiaceae bacterium]|nr:hypothetical protein [Polyangiaceae bacterium]